MTFAARLNRRITQVAVGRHLPSRTVRIRLTVVYGALFLLSGAALMAITYALLVNAGFVFTIQSGPTNGPGQGPVAVVRPLKPLRAAARTATVAPLIRGARQIPFPAGLKTHPSAQTLAHWRAVAQCMRAHRLSKFPNPRASVPRSFAGVGMVSDRDGAIFAIPATINMGSAVALRAVALCGFEPGRTGATAAANDRRTQARGQLLLQSGIALAGMSLLSILLGWFVAGRVLQPLEDSYEAQRQFVANASHELRAPLTRQRALIQVALADPQASFSSLRAAHERVLASEQHLEQIIDGLLALTRGQAGLERREQLDVGSVTSHAILSRESLSASRGLDVRTTLHAAPAEGDPRLLERLVGNIIDNAIRHNVPGGGLDVVTGVRDRRAFVSVSNTGPTVPPEQVERLFEPFERLDGARTRHDGGHGLGLSIVKAIADAHGATLTARPGPQGGLRIEVSFPAASGVAAGRPCPGTESERAVPLGSRLSESRSPASTRAGDGA